jgi:RecJ-like exonuclease
MTRLVHTCPVTGFTVWRDGDCYRVDCGDLMAEFRCDKDISRALRSARDFIKTMQERKEMEHMSDKCPRCEGHGDLYGKDGLTTCPFCNGTGRKDK